MLINVNLLGVGTVYLSVADPHWFQCGSGYGSGSSIFGQCGSRYGSESRSRVLMTKNWTKFTAEFYFIKSKIAIDLSLDLHKGRLSSSRSLHPSKENIWHFKTWIFFTFVGNFDPPGSESVFPTRIRIRIKLAGSGSATLVYLNRKMFLTLVMLGIMVQLFSSGSNLSTVSRLKKKGKPESRRS